MGLEEDRMPPYDSVPRTLLALTPSTRCKQCEMPLQQRECNCHHSSMSNRGRSESHALCFSSMWRIYLVALSLTVLATGVSSGALPAKELPGRPKEFRVDVIRELQKELFKKQKAELWGKLFDEQSAAGLAGTREGGRHRRSAQEDKKVLTMDEEDRLGTFVGEVLACQNIPGLSLGMVRGGVRQALGYGVADMETAWPVDEDTLFGIGSNTKAFAAATMVKLMVSLPFEKRFSFSTPLADILDDFRLPDDIRTAETTLMDVLSHRTGLGSADLGFFAGYPLNMTSQDMCRRLQFLPKVVPFRTAWYYSNTMLIFVSRICEVKTGKGWAEVVAESFWQPLQMNSTVMAPHALSLDNVARPYILRMAVDDMFVEQDARLFDIHPLESAGAIMSSAADMTKWLSYMLDVIKRPSGFEMTALRQLFTERILLPSYLRQVVATETPEPILHIGYDMGFMTSYYKGSMVHWHTGDLHGYSSHLLLVPDWDTAVYVAVNGPSDTATSKALLHLSYFVLELLQGRTPWVNVTLACPEGYDVTPTPDPDEYDYDYHGDDAQDVNANTQVLLRPIEDYLGVFGHGLLGDLAIVREQERNSLLRMELGRFLVADLIPTDDEFIFKVVARAPVADTKDWEAEHVIVFTSTGNAASASGGSEKQKTEDSDASRTEAKNQTEKTEKERRVLDEVHFRWKLELFKFKKSVRFDTALEAQEHEVGGTDVEEENGTEVSEPAPSVDGSGATAVDASSEASILTLLFSALLVRVCSSS